MKLGFFIALLAVNVVVTVNQDASAQERRQSVADGANSKGRAQVKATGKKERGTPEGFTGEKTSWYGFDRFDLLMDDAALTVKSFKASPEEGTGVIGQVEGQLRCIVVVPKEPAQGNPWSWRGRYFDHEPQAEIELLKRGFHIGFIQSDEASLFFMHL